MKLPFFLCLFLAGIFALLPVLAQEDSPAANPTPETKASPAPQDKKIAGVDMFSLDYDENRDLFLTPGTKDPYTGPVFSNYEGGAREMTGRLEDGLMDGIWISYYEDGAKSSEGAYKEGLEDGPWTYWWETGKTESEGAYSKGSPVGKWVTYQEDGKPASEGDYTEGLMDGAWKFYGQNGKVEIIKFERGKKLGPSE